MGILLKFSALIDKINEKFGTLANWLVLLSCLISAGNAVMRYSFNYSSNAWLEIQWYMFGAMFILGASYTLKRNEHVRVDLIYGRLSRKAKLWIDILGCILFLLPTTIIIGWMSWPMFMNSFLLQEASNNAGGLIRWPIKLIVPLGFLLLTLQGVSELIKRISALRGEYELTDCYERPAQ